MDEEHDQSSITVVLTLALFIILLSFFIVLNSLSTFEEQRSSSVLQSIELAFTSRIFQENKAPSTKEDPLRLIGEGYSLKRVQGLFRATFPTINYIRVDTEKGLFYAEIPLTDLENRIAKLRYNAEENRIQPGFFRTIIEMAQNNVLDTRLDILALTGDDTTKTNIDDQRKRLAGTAAFLERVGMPASRITIGFDKGRKDYVLIRVRSAIIDNPANPAGR